MSTSLNHLPEPAWKKEVNQRIAAHRSGKSATAPSETAEQATPAPGSRAAKAAARVATRFAQAPSYSQVLADEARAAVEAAEAASVAAQEAHAKAQMVLAGIEAAANPEPGPELVLRPAPDQFLEPQVAEVVPFASPARQPREHEAERVAEDSAESFAVRWEGELPDRQSTSEGLRATRGTNPADERSLFEPENEDQFEPENREWFRTVSNHAQASEIAVIEPAQPIFGNVIEFPRQLVAARKVRPRLAEGPLVTSAAGAQLSIFEVDPEMISVEPDLEVPKEPEQAAYGAPEWTVPEWSSIRLAPQPEPEYELLEEPEPLPQPMPAIELASLNRRFLASVVDFTLVAGAIVAAAALAANNSSSLPPLRTIEMGSIVALLVAAAAYKTLFFTLARATPGMKYARLALCTFDGGVPTRAQRWVRLAALALSILPVGLGFAWAIFDDQHLTWHDRISRTYLRLR